MENTSLNAVIARYKADPESVYNTWFTNNDNRLKAFRSIRRGVRQVAADIRERTFGNDFKGSSLEFVLNCITEQREVFEGAAHPFYWKPKLRIPDIYESESNKQAFGAFLENCLTAQREDQILREIILLDQKKIKGLGPAVANILYFLHPSVIPPFNTAIVNGFNTLFDQRRKLGSWKEYLEMREVILEMNVRYSQDLSVDLGAFGGLLYEVGIGNLQAGNATPLSEADRVKLNERLTKRHADVASEFQQEDLHSEMQWHLLRIGTALQYEVMPALNDRSKSYAGNDFSILSREVFPKLEVDRETLGTIQLVDVLWFAKDAQRIVGAFEVEKSTSIYSGILRLNDLACSLRDHETVLYLVIPDKREKEVLLQLRRPSFRDQQAPIKYILFSDLRKHCDALCRFGDSIAIIEKISRSAL